MSSGGLFAVRCPGCGQALSVTLANHEKITCDACGDVTDTLGVGQRRTAVFLNDETGHA